MIQQLKPLIISAPFGNYVKPEGATPTLGTFTLRRRRGRLWRTLRTVRYDPFSHAWVNKIGLRNPGIDWLAEKAAEGRVSIADAIVSIHGFDDIEWAKLLERASGLSPLAIELNISCPNVGELAWPETLFADAHSTGVPVIVKLPPVRYEDALEQAANAGIRAFHCCNTLPIPAGGMSGKPLMPVSMQCLQRVRAHFGEHTRSLTLIAGGGITRPQDIDTYADIGATHFAVATACFNPLLLFTSGPLKPILDRAAERSDRR